MNDVIREFLLETQENLAQLDGDLITLEKQPRSKGTLANVFRTFHSIKGTAGFVGLVKLQALTHSAESLLSKLRAAELTFNAEIASVLLAVVDAVRQMLSAIEADGSEGDGDYSHLVAELDRIRTGQPALPVAEPAPKPAEPVVVPPPAPVVLPEPPPIASPTRSTSIVARTAQTMVSAPPSTPETPASTVQEPGADRASAPVADTTLRVDVGLLDKLMTLVGELVLARNQIVQFGSTQDDPAFLGTVQRLNVLTTELQASVMKTRMQPIANVWSKFPRIVRDLAVNCGKQVQFEMEGQDTELDKTIIEAIRDPLTHLVRNAVDHGIESPEKRLASGKLAEGHLRLRAFHEGGKVVIEITDDGQGIDPIRVRDKAVRNNAISAAEASRLTTREMVDLVFLPGLSTAEHVSQLSGRGVGMDVVRTNTEKIGGSVDIESNLGEGTTVTMRIPLTLAIIPALIVESQNQRFCVPMVSLQELVRVDRERSTQLIEMVQGAPVYRLRGNLLPLVYLDRELGLVPADTAIAPDEATIVVLLAEGQSFGLVVDTIHDTQEIVVKPLQQQLKSLSVFSGATIMGDGRVALILDVVGLAQRSRVTLGAVQTTRAAKSASVVMRSLRDRTAALLFTTTNGSRVAISLDQVARLEELPRSAIEQVGDREVVQYRGQILTLVRFDELLGDRSQNRLEGESISVIVHGPPGQQVGLAIGEVIDIVEEELTERAPGGRPGTKFTAVVQGRVAEFVDLSEVLSRFHQTGEART